MVTTKEWWVWIKKNYLDKYFDNENSRRYIRSENYDKAKITSYISKMSSQVKDKMGKNCFIDEKHLIIICMLKKN